jgi:hypothetical protein
VCGVRLSANSISDEIDPGVVKSRENFECPYWLDFSEFVERYQGEKDGS